MEEKLRSISKRIHWSSLLKAAIFAAAWFALPFWLFILVALYLYFVPVAGSGKVALPFLVLLIISAFLGTSAIIAIGLGAIFYYLILIKDLYIIDRKGAHEILVLILVYLLLRSFFEKVGTDFGGLSIIYSFITAILFSGLVLNFIGNFSDAFVETRSFRRMVGWIMFILMWQLLLVGLFLPLDFVYQSAIIFLIAMILIDLLPAYIFGELSQTKTLVTSMSVFALLAIIISTARWGL